MKRARQDLERITQGAHEPTVDDTPHPLRTLSLSFPSDAIGTVDLDVTLDPNVKVTDIVIKVADDWTIVGGFHRVTHSDGQEEQASCSYHARLNLPTLGRLIRGKKLRGTDNAPSEEPPLRASLFVRASTTAGVPVSARDIEVDEDRSHFLIPLGRAESTLLEQLRGIDFDGTTIQPYVNRFGIITFVVGGRPSIGRRPVNELLTLENGHLVAKGRMNVHSNELTALDLVVVGRTSGFKLTIATEHSYDSDRSRRKFGSKLYRFSADFDLAKIAGELPDDTLDLYLQLDGEQFEEPVRRRFGRSRYMVRRKARASRISHESSTILLTPYFTFKAKNPSIYSEVFDTLVFDHMVSAAKHNKRRSLRTNVGDKPVWVIGEMSYKAQDNGMHFFKYMRDHHPEIDAYYVIDKGSPERSNLDGYDHVVDFRSQEHVDVALAADRFVGTHHADYLYPTRSPRFASAVATVPKIFLQHGVMGAKWMVPNYGKKASAFVTDLIITSSDREKQIFRKDFGYADEQIAVTGLPRFDALLAGDVKIVPGRILIIPTWRPWLQDPDSFTDSDYFDHWSSLLHSEHMQTLVREHDLEIVFCLHPNMQQFTPHFNHLGITVVSQGEIDVQHLMKSSQVMITDYSSVAFDFSFLGRPVAYYQFDSHRFANPHVSAHEELPGPIISNENELLSWVSDIARANGTVPPAYRERARRFLAHQDRSSSERVFRAVARARRDNSLLTRLRTSEEFYAAGRLLRRNKRYRPVMKQVYKALRSLPIDPNIVVFESGQGRQLGDNPGAIYEELVRQNDPRLKVWVYNKRFPIRDDSTIIVKRYSPEYFWYLARAKYWVSNQNMPNFIHRRKHGVYIQTWHGTPLKKMFLDIDEIVGRDDGYVGRVTEATRQWSVLVSPNTYTTEIMRSAYAFDGAAVELGYPRNDILLDENAPNRRRALRQQLGLDDCDFVVLYAPTFRDDKPTTRGRFAFEWPFSPEEFVSRFAETNIKLLIRTHVLINTKIPVPQDSDIITDVTKYPDIQELYLAADMLVTDYSSAFFDYSLLRKPIAFYAYDLDKYRQELRGFYLDYETELPGPIVETATKLFDTIAVAQKEGALEGAVPLAEFVDRFAALDDGRASERVVKALLMPQDSRGSKL